MTTESSVLRDDEITPLSFDGRKRELIYLINDCKNTKLAFTSGLFHETRKRLPQGDNLIAKSNGTTNGKGMKKFMI